METNLYVAMGLMKLYKLKIDTASRGQKAIEKIKSGQEYDVIFMDHMMPEMDGIETVKHIRELGYTAPIVALTANAVVGQADMFMLSGFNDFISKPIDMRQLNAVLIKFVRDKQPAEVIEAARNEKIEAGSSNGTNIDLILLESFIRDAKKARDVIEEMCAEFKNEKVLRKYTIIIHGIKSSLWNIGENELAELALKLEAAGREKNIEMLTISTPVFLVKLNELLENLESKLGENSEDQFDEDIEDLHNKLLVIQTMCADYNRKGALDTLAEIKKCSKETKLVLNKIMGHVLHSEFDEAENTAAAYITNLSFGKQKNDN
jgi:CheY-like chemotaxis protein